MLHRLDLRRRLAEVRQPVLLLCGEHYGAPYDLLAGALRVPPERAPALAARWRRAGYAATRRGSLNQAA